MPMPTETDALQPARPHGQEVPYFLICEALRHLEDGWAAFRMMATCRQAQDEAEPVAVNLRAAKRALLDAVAYFMADCPAMPGFDPTDRLAISLRRLAAWDPRPFLPSIILHPPDWMNGTGDLAAEGNMGSWIQVQPQYRGLGPLGVLRAMNPGLHGCIAFQSFIGILEEGHARFFFSPISYARDVPMDAQLVVGPGLIIVLRYRGFAVGICLRYTEQHYEDTMVVPWYTFQLRRGRVPAVSM